MFRILSLENNLSATVLFDLDDTLLGNEMGRFLPAYFKLLQDGLAGVVPEEVFLPFFLDATNKMMAAEDVSRRHSGRD